MSSDTALGAEPPTTAQGASFTYDAFLSYNHQDAAVAAGLHKGLHRIGRRMGQLNALRVFRDSTDMAANPDLWGKVTDAMDRSRYLVVVLSPRAAASEWVNKEVAYWLKRRGLEQLLLVLAEGQLHWDNATHRFDPDLSDAALPVLTEPGVLPTEPLHVDVSADAPWDLQTPTFRDKVTDLAAPIHGKSKYELASDDVREQRRFRRLRQAAIIGLVMLTVIAVVAAGIAIVKQREANRQRDEAIARWLVSEAQPILEGAVSDSPVHAYQRLVAARRLAQTPDDGPLVNALRGVANLNKLTGAEQWSPVTSVAFSPDGHRIVAGSFDNSVRVWDAATGQAVGQPFTGHTASVMGVAFSPDGHRIASVSADNTVRVWDAATGQLVGEPLTGHTGAVQDVAFSPDGTRIVSGSDDTTVRVWDAGTGQPIGQPLTGHTKSVIGLAVTPDGKRIVAGSRDGTVLVWAMATGRPVGRFAHSRPVSDVTVSPDGTRIVSGCEDGTVEVWDADTGKPSGQALTGHTGGVRSVAFSPDGRRIVSGSYDNTVRLWDAGTGQPVGQPFTGHTEGVNAVAFSPDGKRIVSGSDDNTVRVWDADTGRTFLRGTLTGHTDRVFSVAFSPDGHRIASASADKTVRVWDADTGKPVGQPLTGHTKYVNSVAFSPDGKRIVSGSEDKTLRLWNADTGQPIGQPMTAHGQGGAALPVDVPGARNAGPADSDAVASVAFSPDGKRIVSGGGDAAVRVWDADTGQPVGQPLTGHIMAVFSVTFSPEGKLIASGSMDGSVRVWDAVTGRPVGQPLLGHNAFVLSVAFSPDDTTIVSGAGDNNLRVWPTYPDPVSAMCSKLATNMSHRQWQDWVSPDIDYIKVCPDLPVAPD
jgi:WD40 repeat protein